MTMTVLGAERSHVGNVRDHNEDDSFVDRDRGAFVVADGMGGHAAGEVASALTVEVLGDRLGELSPDADPDEAREVLATSIVDAGRRVHRQGEENPEQRGMGTTVTALLLRPDGRWLVGHVGDSRAYLLRDGELRQLTTDHSPHPASSMLTRALGTGEETRPDLFEGEVRDGDLFVLASDGLTDMVDDPDIRRLLEDADAGDPDDRQERLDRTADALVEAALEAGGRDNVTVLLARVVEGQGEVA